jgi:hypothetical protein
MTSFYVLDEKRRVVGATQQQWEAFPEERMLVAETRLPAATVTTFFDGAVDGPDGPPPLFMTTAQIERAWRREARYATWAEAEAGHARIVAKYLEQSGWIGTVSGTLQAREGAAAG